MGRLGTMLLLLSCAAPLAQGQEAPCPPQPLSKIEQMLAGPEHFYSRRWSSLGELRRRSSASVSLSTVVVAPVAHPERTEKGLFVKVSDDAPTSSTPPEHSSFIDSDELLELRQALAVLQQRIVATPTMAPVDEELLALTRDNFTILLTNRHDHHTIVFASGRRNAVSYNATDKEFNDFVDLVDVGLRELGLAPATRP